MTFTNYGCENLKQVGLMGSGTIPTWMSIGSGSGTELVTESGLKNEYTALRKEYTTLNGSTSQQTINTYNYGATTMSGLTLSEFGTWSDATGGNIWDVHRLGSVVFEGTVELQIDVTSKVTQSGVY